MIRQRLKIFALTFTLLFLTACSSENKEAELKPVPKEDVVLVQEKSNVAELKKLLADKQTNEYINIDINESGQVPIVMFHSFVHEFEKGDPSITVTFFKFQSLLEELYEKGYRTISMHEYLTGEINLPRGYTPVIFTFDDGTSGQFSMVENQGELAVNPDSAVGLMLKFNETHKDFATKGVFYVNLGWKGTFNGAGTIDERLTKLTELGYEVHNHTFDHVFLNRIYSAEEMQKQMGKNQKYLSKAVPGAKMETIALPYGSNSKKYSQYIKKGQFEGEEYETKAFFHVGACPSDLPYIKDHDMYNTPRIKAEGITTETEDFRWWLDNTERKELFVSDGIPKTVTVPHTAKENMDVEKLNEMGLKLAIYDRIEPAIPDDEKAKDDDKVVQ